MKKLFLVKYFLAVAVFVVSFGVYFLTTSRYIQAGDSTEMVTAAALRGIAHQPGYPLNNLFGHFAYKANISGINPVFRVNLVSALFQSFTLVIFYFLFIELVSFYEKDVSNLSKLRYLNVFFSAFSSSLMLGFSLIYWQYATKFEVFPLNNLFCVLTVLFCLKIAKNLRNLIITPGVLVILTIKLIILGILGGLGFTHHQTYILIAPICLFILAPEIFSLLQKNRRIFFLAVPVLIGFFAGLIPYFVLMYLFAKAGSYDISGITNFTSILNALFRRDYGTFSPFLSQGGYRPYPFDQIGFFLKQVLNDFTLVGVITIITGIIFSFKEIKRIFWVLFLGLLFSGILFLTYANFPLDTSFNQATVHRFFILPNIFLALFAGYGVYTLLKKMRKGKDIRNLGYLSILIASTLFLFPLYFNFSRANNSGNNLTEKFITDSYSKIPSGSILMVSGDLGNMTSDYYSKVQNKGSNIIAFTPGRFYLDWYLPRLLKDNPTLEVPIPSEGKLFTSATQIASANYKKGVFVSFELTEKDQDLSKNFTLYPSNLLFKVKKRGESVNIDDWKKENEALYRSIDMNVISKIKKNSPSFEENIVFAYAKYFVNCGYVYSEVKLYDEAIIEYQRALSLDNSIRDVYLLMSEALANKKDPDYLGAIQSLENYLAFLVTGEEDKFDVIVGKINDYKKRMSDIYQKEMEDMKEASPSAKPEN